MNTYNQKLREEWRLENDRNSAKGLTLTESGTADWWLSKLYEERQRVDKILDEYYVDINEDGSYSQDYSFNQIIEIIRSKIYQVPEKKEMNTKGYAHKDDLEEEPMF